MKNKVQIIVLTFCITSTFCYSQNDNQNGICFQNNLTLNEIIHKAENESKFILIDLYATWCMPCKRMDSETFKDERVAEFVNKHFVSVKIQMDSTVNDDELIRMKRLEIGKIKDNIVIESYPTYLFFDKTGKPVHTAIGFKKSNIFIEECKMAMNPSQQFYKLLFQFKGLKNNNQNTKFLIKSISNLDNILAAKVVGAYFKKANKRTFMDKSNTELLIKYSDDPQVFTKIASYVRRLKDKQFSSAMNFKLIESVKEDEVIQIKIIKHLNRLDEKTIMDSNSLALLSILPTSTSVLPISEKVINILIKNDYLYTREALEIIKKFTYKITSPGFKLFYWQEKMIDSIYGKRGFAEATSLNIFTKDILDSLKQAAIIGSVVNWDSVSLRYRGHLREDFVDKCVLRAKVYVFQKLSKQDTSYYKSYINSNIAYIEKFKTDTSSTFVDALVINNFAYEAIFLHSMDSSHINWAIAKMQGVLRRNPNDAANTDTYANLLYKIGRVSEALVWQERALKLAKEITHQRIWIDALSKNYEKMRMGLPTWN